MRTGRLLIFCGAALAQAAGMPAPAGAGPAEQESTEIAALAAAPSGAAEADHMGKKKKPSVRRRPAPQGEEAVHAEATHAELAHSKSRLSEKPVPLLKEHTQLPERNPPIIEWNEPFLGPGNIKSGFKIPTGAVWQPAFWVFGSVQSNAGVFNDGVHPGREYGSGRADIFGHLQLTPTERVVIGFSPLSQGPNLGTGVLNVDGQGTQFVNAFNPNIQTFFFEGDTRQLFPGIDPDDRRGLDFGFSVGKQQIFFQEGIMINDNIQALGITKDTIQIPGLTQDIRVTGVYGWGDLRRGDAQPLPDHSAQLLGVFTETDFRRNVVTFDFAFVNSDNPRDWAGVQRGGSGVFWGASSTQRFGDINTAFRINTSTALDAKGPWVNDGVLLLAEISQTQKGSNDILYANVFSSFGNYTSAARSAQVAGPLERAGILFSPLAAGLAGSPLPSDAYSASFGGAIGYQKFFGPRKQLTVELAGKGFTSGDIRGVRESVVALGAQYVQAVDSRTSVHVNGFVLETLEQHFGYGAAVGTTTRF